jgi:hypothetical protein
MLGLLPWLDEKRPKLPIIVLASIAFLAQMIGALTNPVTYHTRTSYTFSETLFTFAGSPLLGHLQDLLHRRVYLLLTTNAHGVATPGATMILGAICVLIMTLSGRLLINAATESQDADGVGQA